jgi:hypothetical protein
VFGLLELEGMSFDFTSDSGATQDIGTGGWTLLLYLAEAYGWGKEGTHPPEGVPPGEWEGDYASNDGQYVSKEDAYALASALERFLADPDRVTKVREVAIQLENDLVEAMRGLGLEQPAPENHDLYPIDEDHLKSLVAFWREGGFRID